VELAVNTRPAAVVVEPVASVRPVFPVARVMVEEKVTVFVLLMVSVVPVGIVMAPPIVMALEPENDWLPTSVVVPVPELKDVPFMTMPPPKVTAGSAVPTFMRKEPPGLTVTGPVKVLSVAPVRFFRAPLTFVAPEIVMAKFRSVVVPASTLRLGSV